MVENFKSKLKSFMSEVLEKMDKDESIKDATHEKIVPVMKNIGVIFKGMDNTACMRALTEIKLAGGSTRRTASFEGPQEVGNIYIRAEYTPKGQMVKYELKKNEETIYKKED